MEETESMKRTIRKKGEETQEHSRQLEGETQKSRIKLEDLTQIQPNMKV